MLDFNATPLLLEAQLAEREREIAALRSPLASEADQLGLRTRLANLLAHLALHLDGRAVGSVVARHPNPAGR